MGTAHTFSDGDKVIAFDLLFSMFYMLFMYMNNIKFEVVVIVLLFVVLGFQLWQMLLFFLDDNDEIDGRRFRVHRRLILKPGVVLLLLLYVLPGTLDPLVVSIDD